MSSSAPYATSQPISIAIPRQHLMTHLTKYSFGATSAIVTSLAFIVSLSASPEPKLPIIGSLLVFAVSDNVADSLGIHIFQESDLKNKSTVNASTLSNFTTRFVLILTFIAIIYLLPITLAAAASIVWGISILVALSYLIAVEQGAKVSTAIIQHVAVAALVIASSLILREWIITFFA